MGKVGCWNRHGQSSRAAIIVNDVQKTQDIRLMDVFAIGPLMIWAGLSKKKLPPLVKNLMVVIGIGTIIYNFNNFVVESKEKKSQGQII